MKPAFALSRHRPAPQSAARRPVPPEMPGTADEASPVLAYLADVEAAIGGRPELRTADVAAMFGLSTKAIQNYVALGRLRRLGAGRNSRITAASVRTYAAERVAQKEKRPGWDQQPGRREGGTLP